MNSLSLILPTLKSAHPYLSTADTCHSLFLDKLSFLICICLIIGVQSRFLICLSDNCLFLVTTQACCTTIPTRRRAASLHHSLSFSHLAAPFSFFSWTHVHPLWTPLVCLFFRSRIRDTPDLSPDIENKTYTKTEIIILETALFSPSLCLSSICLCLSCAFVALSWLLLVCMFVYRNVGFYAYDRYF